ncbi:MAG: SagB family peptide dehydrogenase [Thermoanaerobaculum sp.]|nr:SagB family peptide dehydrogenase [Thermoanaerobaculum sp.]
MKALVLAPLVLVVFWFLLCRWLGKPLSRAELRALVGLLVGIYLAATAALGIFWVSRMELPVFDWHYLLGYCLLVVAAWHLFLEWGALAALPRRLGTHLKAFPSWFRWAVPLGLSLLVLGVVLSRTWISGDRTIPSAPVRTLQSAGNVPKPVPSTPVATNQAPVGPAAQEVVGYLMRESSTGFAGLVRRGLFFGPKVASLRPVSGNPRLTLPPPLAQGPQGVHSALLWLSQPANPRCGVGSLEELATLLFAASGVTEKRSWAGETLYLRSAPSAGALYPVETYLVAFGHGPVPPGVYAYIPQEHSLLPLPMEATEGPWAQAVGLGKGSTLPGPLVVFTTVFQRTVWKYGSRSYRYVALDAGHNVANLLLTAAAFSWPVRVTPLFSDPEVERLLHLNPMEEGAMAVAMLGQLPRGPWVVPSFREFPSPKNRDQLELTRLSHQLTSWQWGDGPPWVWQPRAWEVEPAARLGAADVVQLIKSRRSFRRFAGQPLAAGQLNAILSSLAPLSACLPGSSGVDIHAVVVRDQEHAPGVYRWRGGRGGWELVRGGAFGQSLYRAGLSQELLARAAAAVVFSLDTTALAAEFGQRGFRLGLLAAGALGELVYLSAGGVGLKACGVGAFVDEAMRELLLLEPGKDPVYLVALGQG